MFAFVENRHKTNYHHSNNGGHNILDDKNGGHNILDDKIL